MCQKATGIIVTVASLVPQVDCGSEFSTSLLADANDLNLGSFLKSTYADICPVRLFRGRLHYFVENSKYQEC